MVVKENLYRLLGKTAGGCFNLLNMLLKGNLPPFGSVCIVVEEQGRYLLLVQSHGKVCLPGGFMRWMEDPLETARRECAEETGLEVQVRDFIGCFSCPSDHAMRMSTLTMVYSTQISGGRLRRKAEGKPVWCTEVEALARLDLRYRRFLEAYLRFYRQAKAVDQVAEPAPISERV